MSVSRVLRTISAVRAPSVWYRAHRGRVPRVRRAAAVRRRAYQTNLAKFLEQQVDFLVGADGDPQAVGDGRGSASGGRGSCGP